VACANGFSPHAEKALAKACSPDGPFLNCKNRPALVEVDQRHVEPGALFLELDVARAVGTDIGEADQEEARR
jgi:hypothetical protein